MKKAVIIILIIIFLSVTYWLVSPFWRTEKVSEGLPVISPSVPETNDEEKAENEVIIVKSGMFTGFDRIHTGSGTASVLKIGDKSYIRFEENFTVNNGPDLYVGLGENGKYIKGSELGKLKGNVGSQNYELPAGVTTEDVKEVWIWCKAFSVPFAKAELN
ncbi:MAG: DM13 domain-containing protein [bacterium]|nr:DM13 domain-containing protein [bacterium]